MIPYLKAVELTFACLGSKNRQSFYPLSKWVEAPSSEEKFEQYIQRINFDSHLGFFIRQRSDRQLIGVVNINEIVKGAFQSGYLGFYAFEKYHPFHMKNYLYQNFII